MIDHVSVAVSDLDRAARFYEAVLATIGLIPDEGARRAILVDNPCQRYEWNWR